MLGLCAIWSPRAAAQNRSLPQVTIRMDRVPMSQIMSEIERQTKYLFVTGSDVKTDRITSLDVTAVPLTEALNRMVAGADLTYDIRSLSIILSVKKAEQPAAVAGYVRDGSGQPVIGATIIVRDTSTGTTTDADGRFTLSVPAPSTAWLEVSYLGYEPQAVAVGNRTSFDITLREAASEIESVVVTALGIKRSEKALSYNAQQINAEDIVAVKDVNFVNSLNGKVAGLNINASSSGVGGSSKVVMRGSKSIEQSSNALYVIDGIPMCNFRSDGSEEFDSQGSSEAIADLNPEDIESMTVLSGAAAAALYGSDAANGAILITTKRGKAGQTTVTVTSNTEVLAPFVMPMFQTRYGTGDKLAGAANGIYSWGERLNAFNYRGYDPADDYFQTGVVGTETVSFSTGNERSQTYASARRRQFARYYSQQRLRPLQLHFPQYLVVPQGQDAPRSGCQLHYPERPQHGQSGRLLQPAGVGLPLPARRRLGGCGDVRTLQPLARHLRAVLADDGSRYLSDAEPLLDQLPQPAREPQGPLHDQRLADLRHPRLALRFRAASGWTTSNSDYTEKLYASTNNLRTEGSPNGLYGITKTNDRQTYGDVMVNINKTFGENWSLQANVGASISDMRSDASKVRGPIAYGEQTGYDKDGNAIYEPNNIPNVFNVYNLLANSKTGPRADRLARAARSRSSSRPRWASRGRIYLTVTGRNDWPSQLAGPNSVNSSFFYPSVGASVVLSEIIPNMPKNLSYVKLRASYASVGLAFSRFYANPTRSWNSSTNSWNLSSQSPLYDLKPERTKSFEVGLTMRFLRHFNFDISYYNTRTINQTFNTGIPASSMYSKVYKQDGDVRNRGFEMSLGYKNTWNRFSWDSNFTASANRNKIMKLGKEVIDPNTGKVTPIGDLNVGGMGNVRFILREGGSLGDIYSRADLRRDSNGDIYQDMDGNIFVDNKTQTKDFIKLGSVFPDANLAWRNDFRWRNFNFGFLLTARLGGVVYSRTQAVMDYYGVSASSADARDAGGIVINGNDLIDAQKWYQTVANGDTTPQYYTYSATNVRLQEASIGYTIPRKKLGDVCDITLSIVGRNLWMLYNKAPFDPEAVATTSNYYQGIDYFMMPSLRSIGFNVRVKF